MRSSIAMGTCWIIVLCQQSMGEPTRRAVSPWHARSDELPALAHEVEATLEIGCREIVTFEPVIARIRLTNNDQRPLTLRVREDGGPYLVASLVARGDEGFFRHHQWLRTSGPSSREITLAPGESTAGEFLILFGGPLTGFPFAEAGRYSVKFACQPDRHSAPVYSQDVEITVTPDDRGNAGFLRDLSELSYVHSGWDRESIVRGNGEDYIIGIRLLRRIIRQQTPQLIDPEGDVYNRKQTKLVASLTEMLERFPNTSYAGYLARFLGLVHVETFEHEISHRGAGSWGETKASPDHEEVTELCQAEYEKALRYLTIASQADLWPRTTAAFNLARLHGLAEEWAKVSAVCDKLRTHYAEQNGAALADKLEREVRKYREKLARRKEAE